MNESMQSFIPWLYVFCTLFAASLGSFANVVVYRVPKRLSLISPPSACPKCGTRIKPYDNIPVLSWLILRGKCRQCKNPISPIYPIVEAVCGAMGAFLCHTIVVPHVQLFGLDGVALHIMGLFIALTLFAVTCLALAIIDLNTTELPPEITLPMAILGIAVAWLIPSSWPYTYILGNIETVDAVLGAAIGASLIVLIIAAYYLFTKRIGMGGGDIWMMAMVGAWLGWQALPFIFFA
ncbi:MAG: prepilin peptidase, partial [Proteobacteria bacterium]|nr:prepilin peptidase [Pseudomonadota bacterium]